MPPFLPVQGLTRSQDVRIGGKLLRPGITSYIDLGFLATPYGSPTFTFSKVGKKAAGPGLKKGVWFGYAVTAIDGSGGETPLGVLAAAKTETGVETESNLNFAIPAWEAVPNAVGYNVYRTGVSVTGFSTEAAALTGTPGLVGTTSTTTFTDAGNVETPGVEAPLTNTSSFNTGKGAYKPLKELQSHSAIGAYIIVGGLSNSSSDWIISAGGTLSAIESKLKVTLGETTWKRRSDGRVTITKSTQLTVTAASAGKFQGIYFVFNTAAGVLEVVAGEAVTEAKLVVYPTLKATQIPFASGLVGETELEIATPPTAIAPGLVDLRGSLRA